MPSYQDMVDALTKAREAVAPLPTPGQALSTAANLLGPSRGGLSYLRPFPPRVPNPTNWPGAQAQTGPLGVPPPVGRGQYTSNPPQKGPERIERAAINLDGKIYAGPNHATAIRTAEQSTGQNFEDMISALKSDDPVDGFLTTHGRFVSRKEAAAIAKSTDALHPGHNNDLWGGLASEDIKKGQLWGMPLAAGAAATQQNEQPAN